MSLPELHFHETKKLLKQISSQNAAKWLLEIGYYPERYVVPPVFKIKTLRLKKQPIFSIKRKNNSEVYNPIKSNVLSISFPKTKLTERTYGIIHPDLYHDLVFHLTSNWNEVIDLIFSPLNKIYSYSFPIPVDANEMGKLTKLRSGRMIYEFLNMAENDLVSESYNYQFLLKTDVKNFYPSIYTHSIAWAIHTKEKIRKQGNRNAYKKFFGLLLDRLCQNSNDGCTNGIPVGSAVSDLISEIVLSAVDKKCSQELDRSGIKYLAVRFKDDYRFLCNSKDDADTILTKLQSALKEYNLVLNETKTNVQELPAGLFRNWTKEYEQLNELNEFPISYKSFKKCYDRVLEINDKFPGTGVIDRFISDLISRNYNLNLKLDSREVLKVLSLLIHLIDVRPKILPSILAVTEVILKRHESNSTLTQRIIEIVTNIYDTEEAKSEVNEYRIIWLAYFLKVNRNHCVKVTKNKANKYSESIRTNTNQLFKGLKGVEIYTSYAETKKKQSLSLYLDIFNKKE